MASVPNHFFTRSQTESAVLRLFRRACLLRTQGRDAEAERIETGELSRMMADASGEAAAADWPALFAAEERRVADAAVLAELLGPLLADRLQAVASGPAAAPGSPVPFPRPDHGGPPDVADLIEGMLAQERSESASRRSA